MYTRILVAIDDSATSTKALDEAIHLARVLGAKLCITHVVDEAPVLQPTMGTYLNVDKVRDDMHQVGTQLLEAARAKAAAQGVEAEQMLIGSVRRRIAEVIADAVRSWNADLIVMGTHGRRGFQRLLVGSVAENLIRIASTSLMLVRAGEDQTGSAAI